MVSIRRTAASSKTLTSNTAKLSSESVPFVDIYAHLTYTWSLYDAALTTSEYKAEEAAGKHGAVYASAHETIKVRSSSAGLT